jgi:Alw26I/Eco31I/Esp3I family type II restriction m6 adenine DNA methyltransferase
MLKPNFELISSKHSLDDALKDLFLENLDYFRIENDPDASHPQSTTAWRMVVPERGSRPFVLAQHRGLSGMGRQKVSQLYIERVIPHRDGQPSTQPALYGFTDGARWVFFSADPARNRDDRFDLSADTWEFESTKGKFSRLQREDLEFQTRAGSKRPLVDFLFDSAALSADERFKRYVAYVREALMRAVVDDECALAQVIYFLLEEPEARAGGEIRFATEDGRLLKSLKEIFFVAGRHLGDAVAGAVDTLLLRYIMLRFLESYHPEAIVGLRSVRDLLSEGKLIVKTAERQDGKLAAIQMRLQDGTVGAATFTDTELKLAEQLTRPLAVDVSRAKRRTKGSDAINLELFAFEDEQALATAVLDEEKKRETHLGGDFYLADLGRAARAVEELLLEDPKSKGAKLLEDFLGRTGAPERAHWDFRYEDLRPQTLQDYYESALGTSVQLGFDTRTESLEVSVGKDQRQRKELGAYYTDPRLCRFMVERSVQPLFTERLAQLRKAIAAKDESSARSAYSGIVEMTVCDPTMGSAPFLRSAFDYLSQQYVPLCSTLLEAESKLPAFYAGVLGDAPYLVNGGRMDEDGVGRWEWHILRRMLYGVDIDLKAVCIACQTFALSALKYLRQGERFPSFFNLNLKLGNALISPVAPSARQELSRKHRSAIVRLMALRRQAVTLPDSPTAYETLANLLNEADALKTPILVDLVEEHVYPALREHTQALRPFCWELEFPEVFFADDGHPKQSPGFDVMVGNPPWEEIELDEDQFFGSLDPTYALTKRGSRKSLRQALLRLPPVATQYDRARSRSDAVSRFINSSGWYEFQKLQRSDGRQGFVPQNNYFRLAIEVFYKLSSPHAFVSVVSPHGIVGDEGTKSIRDILFKSTTLQPVVAFKEKNDIFARPQAFATISFRKSGATHAVELVDNLSSADDLSNLPSRIPVAVSTIKRCSPLSWALIDAVDALDLRVLEKLHSFPSLVDTASAPWDYRQGTEEVNETRGATMWAPSKTQYVMRKGEFTEQFRIKDEVAQYLKETDILKKSKYAETWRVVWRDVINENAERRMLWAVVPPKSGIGNSLNWVIPDLSAPVSAYLVCVMNSLLAEYRARQLSTNNHMSKFMVKQLPFPRLLPGDPLFDRIVRLGWLLLAGL